MEIDLSFSKICMQCGMCCDGTLFTKANIKNREDELLAKSLGLPTFSTSDSKIFFEQPCQLFNKTCTVYDKPRPNCCSKFICEPLQKVGTNEITFNDAENQILLALETRKQVMEMASFITDYKNHTLQQLLTEITPKPSGEILQHKQLFRKIVSLRVLLNKLIQKKS
jgi:hypothetical protein